MWLPMGTALPESALEIVSHCLFHCDVSRIDETADGRFVIESGHLGVWSRGATLAGVLDANGVSYTAVDGQPGWESRDDGAGATRLGLRMGTADRLVFADPPQPQAMSGLLEFVETGARTTANATLFAITNDAMSGVRLWLDTSGTYYRLNWNNGSTTRTATLASGQPTSGQRVRLRWTWDEDGAITLWQSINGAAETSATAAALAIPAAWATDAVVRVNSRAPASNAAQACYHAIKLVGGVVDADELQWWR